MTVSLAMFLGAFGVSYWLPGRLVRAHATQIHPSVLLTVWAASMAAVLVTFAAGVVLLLVPGHGVPGGPLSAVSSCWLSIRHGISPRVEELSGLLGSVLLLAGATRILVIGSRLARRHARARRERLSVLRLAARVEPGSPAILWLAHDRPLAFSMSGRPGYLVATDGLRHQLTDDETEAVLEHERAHVRGRHHLLITVVDVLRAGLPFLPLFRAAPNAVRELVELAADACAARRCGAATVRSALIRVTGDGSPGTSLAFGRDALETRLERLNRTPRPATWARRSLSCGYVGTASLLPFLASVAVFTASSVLFCGVH